MKLRRQFMELNRAVCIDMPNLNIPWFHQKFCEQLAASDGKRTTIFFTLSN